jgi:uncharacterized protein YggE
MDVSRFRGPAFVAAALAVSVGVALVTQLWLAPRQIASAAPTEQQNEREVPRITVTGEGEVKVEPDLAIVTVGVAQTGATSNEALAAANSVLAAVSAAVRAQGVQDRDIQTSGLSLQPVYRSQQRGGDQPPEIVGYRASNNLTITVRTISQAGPVLDAAVAAGANSIGGIRFSVADVETPRRQALANATADAEAKARAIASAAGVSLAGVLSIVESSVSTPRPAADTALRAVPAPAEGFAATPVETGELVIRARLQASYRI